MITLPFGRIGRSCPPMLRVMGWTMRGASQVMLQNNVLCGGLFFIALGVDAWLQATPQIFGAAFIGTLCATLTAQRWVGDNEGLRQGLYGYNGCLTGIALALFLPSTPLLWACIPLSCAASVGVSLALHHFLRRWRLPIFTAPFVLISWCVLLASQTFHGLHPDVAVSPAAQATSGLSSWWLLHGVFSGISQIFLSASALSGVLMVAGLAIASPRAALLALGGSLCGALIATLGGADISAVNGGLYGFSPALTAIALGTGFTRSSLTASGYALAGAACCTLIQGALNALLHPLPAFTMPFVITSWLFIAAAQERQRKYRDNK